MKPNLWIGGVLTKENEDRIAGLLENVTMGISMDDPDHTIRTILHGAHRIGRPAEFPVVTWAFEPKDLIPLEDHNGCGLVVRYEHSGHGIFYDGREWLHLGICHGELFLSLPPANSNDPIREARLKRMYALLKQPVFPLRVVDSARSELQAWADLRRWAGWQ